MVLLCPLKKFRKNTNFIEVIFLGSCKSGIYVQAYLDRSATINPSCLDTCLKDCFGKGKIISCIYNALQSSQLPTTSPIKRLWEEKLGSEMSNKAWADSQTPGTASSSSKSCIGYTIRKNCLEYFQVFLLNVTNARQLMRPCFTVMHYAPVFKAFGARFSMSFLKLLGNILNRMSF